MDDQQKETLAADQVQSNIGTSKNGAGNEIKTIDKKAKKSIKEITREKSFESPDFDFEVISEETNAQTIERVK